jgi:cytidylate kinase
LRQSAIWRTQGPCVIIGRCADYTLADRPNALRLFIDAPLPKAHRDRDAARASDRGQGEGPHHPKTDKRRAAYYEYYSSQKWGDVDSYDVCMDSSVFGLEGTVEIIEQLAARKEARLGA